MKFRLYNEKGTIFSTLITGKVREIISCGLSQKRSEGIFNTYRLPLHVGGFHSYKDGRLTIERLS